MRSKRLNFQSPLFRFSDEHGGKLRQRRRGRGARPLSSKLSLYLVLKVNPVTDGRRRSLRMPKNSAILHETLNWEAKKYGVKIEQKAVCNDHVHLMLRIGTRTLYKAFIRSLTGQIAKKIKALERAVTDGPEHLEPKKTFWMYRPFTRVIRGLKAYKTLQGYIRLNEQEALGQIPYQKDRLKNLEDRYGLLVWV